MRKSIRPLIAMTAALALTVTAGMSALAQADNTDKHFSVIEAASNEDSLTIPEIAKKCGTSVVAIETETKVVYNTYDNNYYNPFGGIMAMVTATATAADAAARRNTPRRRPVPASSSRKTAMC